LNSTQFEEKQMKYAETPCGWEPCENNEVTELDEILLEIANHKYEIATPVFDSKNTLYMSEAILKFKKLGVNGETKIELELNNELDYYALVIDELELENGGHRNEILFKWYEDSIENLYSNLVGEKGLDARSPKGKGAHGLPGGKGGRGKTRHAPAVFIFIKTLSLVSTSVDETSFEFDLKGIPGGWGGIGGNGSNGNEGKRGKHGRQGGLFNACKRGKNGKRGGQPGKGGQGGNGGCGGNGPDLTILIDDKALWGILERSKYDVSGADPVIRTGGENAPGWGGMPGEAGLPGRGGRGGRRAGNCGGGNRGPSGLPAKEIGNPPRVTPEWKNWNLGFGLPGTAGIDGDYDFDGFQEVYRIVFNDPSVAPVED
jgi:hypothetical protein